MSFVSIFTDEFYNLIKVNVVMQMFPNISPDEHLFLLQCVVGLLKIICIYIDYSVDNNVFIEKLQQNDYEDVKWLLTILLPYINTMNRQLANIKTLNEIYTAKMENVDINNTLPIYLYSNIQYDYCSHDKPIKETTFSKLHVIENYYLLINTIMRCFNRLHPNWINILPMRQDMFRTTKLYIDTKNKLTNHEFAVFNHVIDYPITSVYDNAIYLDVANKIKGLPIDDLYNTLSMHLYENIVYHKWLLYYIGCTYNAQKLVVPAILFFNTYFGSAIMNCFIQNLNWEKITTDIQQKFVGRWKDLIDMLEQNEQIGVQPTVHDVIIIDQHYIRTFVFSIVKFYENKYGNLVSDKDYVKLEKNPNNPKEKPSLMSIIASARSVNIMYLYRFLQKSIAEFKFTWYALKLMNSDKTQFISINEQNAYYGKHTDIIVTYKNVYNFCKSFVHHNKNKIYVHYPKYWESLNADAKNEIVNRLNAKSVNWFHINKNILALDKFLYDTEPNIGVINKKIHNFLLNSIIDIVFETLVMTGTLTYMLPINDITNKKVYDITNSNHKKMIVDKISKMYFAEDSKYMTHAYYYMTSKPFGNTPKYSLKKMSKLYGYSEFASDPNYAWYLNIAFNWVSQIQFCHIFINKRVTFVTGTTGAGKSTQIPKLNCYFGVAIDYKLNYTVVITCPRVNLVKKNSEHVSHELALPFKTSDGNDTENYQVQFKHMHEKRIKQDNTPKLIFVTDGSLLQEIKNPLLKKITTDSLFHQENLYDTVIVDEAHEHNINMDMILTFMKHVAFYNNQLRLTIVSATIDQDEHIYRMFFKKINDNLKYPLNTWIEENKLDRKYIDRRFNIQPPTKNTSMPKITEIIELTMTPEEVVQRIAMRGSGNVLLFQPGKAEIDKSLQILNSPGYLPDDMLAVPYYATMEKSQYPQNMEFAKEIDDRITDIRIDKSQMFTESELLVGNKHYSKYVMVATNIAESGITFKNLTFVVDTGKEKVLEYDADKRRSTLREHKITHQSRIQRRGRVGRTRAGTIYYMYDPSTLEDTKLYKISTSNIKIPVLFEYLKAPDDISFFTTTFEDILSGNVLSDDVYDAFFTSFLKKYDESVSSIFIKQMVLLVQNNENTPKAKFKQIVNQHIAESRVSDAIAHNMHRVLNIWEFVKSNYIINGKAYTYKGHNNLKYANDYFCNVYSSGVDLQCLIDKTGKFYLIHPDELNIKRNILGEIIKMIKSKMQVFIDELFRQSYITFDKSGQIVKTAVGQFVNTVVMKLAELSIETDYAQVMGICYLLLDVNNNPNDATYLNDLFNLFALLTLTNSNPTRLSAATNSDKHLTEKERTFLLRQKFKSFSSSIQTDDNDDIDLYINFGKIIDKMIVGRDNGHISYIDFISANKQTPAIRKLLSRTSSDSSDESETNRNNTYLAIITQLFVPYLYNRLNDFEPILNSIHTTVHNLHPNKGNNYFKLREKLRLGYHNIITANFDLFIEAQKHMKYIRQYLDKLHINPIKGGFLFSQPDAICKRISVTPFYIPVIHSSFDTICLMGQTALSTMYTGDYIMYLNQDEGKKMHTIMKVNKYFLELICYAYKEFKKEKLNYKDFTIEQLRLVMDYYTTLQNINEDMKIAKNRTNIFHVIDMLKN